MGKRHPYEGGAWSIGGVINRQPPASAIEAAQRKQQILAHWLPYAEQRAADTGRAIYAGIVEGYRAELSSLDDMIARGTRGSQKRTRRAA